LAVPVDTQSVEPGFLSSLRQALTFASTDDSRHMLKSAYLDVDAKRGHRIVATDSRRLSVFPCGILPLPESLIVPSPSS
jgi:DNA polymerase III sliding clamp (beta) subunit (PCNA family)